MKQTKIQRQPLRVMYSWIIEKVEKDLNLDTRRINYRWCPNLKNKTGSCTNVRDHATGMITHWVLVYPGGGLLDTSITIAHEMRHVWQVQNGYRDWPRSNNSVFIWCKKVFPMSMKHAIRPQEIDAKLYSYHIMLGSPRPPMPEYVVS